MSLFSSLSSSVALTFSSCSLSLELDTLGFSVITNFVLGGLSFYLLEESSANIGDLVLDELDEDVSLFFSLLKIVFKYKVSTFSIPVLNSLKELSHHFRYAGIKIGITRPKPKVFRIPSANLPTLHTL